MEALTDALKTALTSTQTKILAGYQLAVDIASHPLAGPSVVALQTQATELEATICFTRSLLLHRKWSPEERETVSSMDIKKWLADIATSHQYIDQLTKAASPFKVSLPKPPSSSGKASEKGSSKGSSSGGSEPSKIKGSRGVKAES